MLLLLASYENHVHFVFLFLLPFMRITLIESVYFLFSGYRSISELALTNCIYTKNLI